MGNIVGRMIASVLVSSLQNIDAKIAMLHLMELELGLLDWQVGEGIGEILGFVISD